MHKKIRGKTAYLYRSSWVPKGTAGNTHGYAVQRYVGSIPVESRSVPDALREVLTADELEFAARLSQVHVIDAALIEPV